MRLSSLILILTLPSAVLAAEGKKSPAASRRTTTARAASSEAKRVDLFGGYTRLGAGEATLGGFEVAASVPFRGRIRAVFDLSAASGTFGLADVSQSHLMVGPGLMGTHGRVRPFGRLLVGAVRGKTDVDGLSESSTNLGLAVAGGADYVLSRRWAVRGQLGLWLVDGELDPHLSIGAVYRFGR